MQQLQRKLDQLHSEMRIAGSADDERAMTLGLVDVAYEWARGTSFADIMQRTSLQEGTIVRAITRLQELLVKLGNVMSVRPQQGNRLARQGSLDPRQILGNDDMQARLKFVSIKMRRDIAFATSLYFNESAVHPTT